MRNLLPAHIADLRRSGLSDDAITLAGFEMVTVQQIKMILGFDLSGIDSAYKIPYPNCDGFSRLRCFPAEGAKIAKYYQKKDSGNRLYIPPAVASKLDDLSTTIYLTEGEKKALRASQEGISCIAIGGLWNWRDKDSGLISDFDKIPLDGRDVHLVPDNDYLLPDRHGEKKNLRQAVQGLAEALIAKGALVSIVELPKGTAKGLDDYLITHSIAEFLALPTKQVRTLSIDEAVAEVNLDTLDAVLKRVAVLYSASKRELLISELSKSLKVSKTAIKADLKRYGAKLGTDQTEKNGLPMVALFPALVDLVEDDGEAVFLIKDGSDLRVETVVELDGVQKRPPNKTDLPYLLTRAEQCLAYYKSEDQTLFDDLLTYLQRFSFLPADQWSIIAIYVLSTYLQDHPDIHYQAMILFHAVPERGKSRTGKAIAYVAYRGCHVVDMRETNIFRLSGNMGATIFFDIMDLWKKAERNGSEDVLLLRYEKGAKVSRVLYPEKGAFADTVHYSIYGPTLMASNAEVHKILGSRCLSFSMPNAPGNYENPTPALGLDIKERLVAWRGRMMGTRLPEIMTIHGIAGRLWDITKPLFQICKVVCPERFDALVDTVLDIAGERIREKKESFDGLLVQVIFEMTQGDADHFDISTADVTTRFNELWNGEKPKRAEWTGRRLKALGVPTDTKSGHSKIHLDREARDILIMQYGFIPQGGEITSNTSNTSKDTEYKGTLPFEVPVETNCQHREPRKTSDTVIDVNSVSCNEVEDIEVIPGVFTKVVEKENLREVRI
jgi:hypothetical protein